MKSSLITAGALAFLLMLSRVAAAQDLASQLVGVWKRTSHIQKDLATGATMKPSGENPVGPTIFTRGGYFIWLLVADGRKAPVGPAASDAERAALFNTAAFGSGTYSIEGGQVVLRYDSSWIQSWTGTERRADMQVLGKVLTWTSPQYQTRTVKTRVAIITFERLE